MIKGDVVKLVRAVRDAYGGSYAAGTYLVVLRAPCGCERGGKWQGGAPVIPHTDPHLLCVTAACDPSCVEDGEGSSCIPVNAVVSTGQREAVCMCGSVHPGGAACGIAS